MRIGSYPNFGVVVFPTTSSDLWSRFHDHDIIQRQITRKWHKIELYLQWRTNRKSYMVYWTAPFLRPWMIPNQDFKVTPLFEISQKRPYGGTPGALPHHAIHFAARCYASAAYVVMRCLSVCVRVCLSRSWIVSKLINISSFFSPSGRLAKPF